MLGYSCQIMQDHAVLQLQPPYHLNPPPTTNTRPTTAPHPHTTPQPRRPSPPPTRPPGPPPPDPALSTLNIGPNTGEEDFIILQYNVNGLQGRLSELLHYMEANNVMVAALQETKLAKDTRLRPIPNYSIVHNDRNHFGGGIAFLIHHTIPFREVIQSAELNNDPHAQVQTISISSDTSKLELRNVYIPPRNSYIPQLLRSLRDSVTMHLYLVTSMPTTITGIAESLKMPGEDSLLSKLIKLTLEY